MTFDRNMPWPRLARYDQSLPVFALLQDYGENIKVMRCGTPAVEVAVIATGQLSNFCQLFGLDIPRELCDHPDSHHDTLDGDLICSRCGYGT